MNEDEDMDDMDDNGDMDDLFICENCSSKYEVSSKTAVFIYFTIFSINELDALNDLYIKESSILDSCKNKSCIVLILLSSSI